jgi:hypothetical protein
MLRTEKHLTNETVLMFDCCFYDFRDMSPPNILVEDIVVESCLSKERHRAR